MAIPTAQGGLTLRPQKAAGESDAAFQARLQVWIAGGSGVTLGGAGIPKPVYRAAGDLVSPSGAVLGAFPVENADALPAPTRMGPFGRSDAGLIELDDPGFGQGRFLPMPVAPPGRGPGLRRGGPSNGPVFRGPIGALPTSLREPTDPTPYDLERETARLATRYDPSWGTPPDRLGLAWDPVRFLYEPTNDRDGLPYAFAARDARYLQAVQRPDGTWNERWVLALAPTPDRDRPYRGLDRAESSRLDAEVARMRRAESSYDARWKRGEVTRYENPAIEFTPRYGPGKQAPKLSDFAWVGWRQLPVGCPYPYPAMPVPIQDYTSGRWLAEDYVPSIPLPSPYDQVPWRCVVPAAPGSAVGYAQSGPDGAAVSGTDNGGRHSLEARRQDSVGMPSVSGSLGASLRSLERPPGESPLLSAPVVRGAPCRLVDTDAGRAEPKAASFAISFGNEAPSVLPTGSSRALKRLLVSPCTAVPIVVLPTAVYGTKLACGCGATCPSDVSLRPRLDMEWTSHSNDAPDSGSTTPKPGAPWPPDIDRAIWAGCFASSDHPDGTECDPKVHAARASGAGILFVPPPTRANEPGKAPGIRTVVVSAVVSGPSVGGGKAFKATCEFRLSITRICGIDGDSYEIDGTVAVSGDSLPTSWSPVAPDCGCKLDIKHTDAIATPLSLPPLAPLTSASWVLPRAMIAVTRTTTVECKPTRSVCATPKSHALPPYDVAVEFTWTINLPARSSTPAVSLLTRTALDQVPVGLAQSAGAGTLQYEVHANVAGEPGDIAKASSAVVSVAPFSPAVVLAVIDGAGQPRPALLRESRRAATKIGNIAANASRLFKGATTEVPTTGAGTVPKGLGFANVFFDDTGGVEVARWVAGRLLDDGPNQVVVIVGHSLGGSAATQAANILADWGIGVDELLLIDRLYHPHKNFVELYAALKTCRRSIDPRGCINAFPDDHQLSPIAQDAKSGVVHVSDVAADPSAKVVLRDTVYAFAGDRRRTPHGRGNDQLYFPLAHDDIADDPATFATLSRRWTSSGSAAVPVNSCRSNLIYARGRAKLRALGAR